MPLPNVASPKKKERTINGVSNRSGGSPRHHRTTVRLCHMPNPRATVDAAFMKNFDDQRHIVNEMRDSTAVHAPDHHAYRVPPPLPVSRDMLASMRGEPAAVRELSPQRPPKGAAGLMGQDRPDTFRVKDAEPRVPTTAPINASPRRRNLGDTNASGRTAASSNGGASLMYDASSSPRQSGATFGDSSSAGTTSRPTAAQRFLQGDLYSKPSVLPTVMPAPLAAHGRSGATFRPDTLPLTQAVPGTGSHAPTEARFDANTRGLNIARVAQEDKLRAQVAREVKTEVRRQQERAVVSSRLAEGERGLRIEEGRIQSKARQRGEYTSRMASYKFTK